MTMTMDNDACYPWAPNPVMPAARATAVAAMVWALCAGHALADQPAAISPANVQTAAQSSANGATAAAEADDGTTASRPRGGMAGPALLPAAAPAWLVSHAQGVSAVPARPAKVVAMDLATLDTLQTLGIEANGVPSTPFPRHLAGYENPRFLKVGTLFVPNLPVIQGIAPQLIVVGGRSAGKYADLAKIAPTIDLTPDRADRIGSLARNAETLGKLFGKEARAASEIKNLRTAVTKLQAKAAKAGSALVVLTTAGKISAQAPGARFGAIHDTFGFRPAMPKLEPAGKGNLVSVEEIRQADPEWIFVIDRDAAIGRAATAASPLDHEAIRQTRAGKRGRIVQLDAVSWYLLDGGGLTGMQENVRQISRLLD